MQSKIFNYNWDFSDYPTINKNTPTVFSCFCGGGGSTMGYKLAGFNCIGGIEIDKKMADIYKINHKPKFFFTNDIINLNKYFHHLKNLDILDGSPPCSSFSISGNREKDWGIMKNFREGQEKQILNNLFFVFLDIVNEIKPKIFIAENVCGLKFGNAKIYISKILKKANDYGYIVQIFELYGPDCGLPQKRKRLFFVGINKKFSQKTFKLNFINQKPIFFSEVFDETNTNENLNKAYLKLWKKKIKSDYSLADINERLFHKRKFFNYILAKKNKICNTITGTKNIIPFDAPRFLNKNELLKIGSFPKSFNFLNADPQYIIGMSVPPIMTAFLAYQLKQQFFQKEKRSL